MAFTNPQVNVLNPNEFVQTYQGAKDAEVGRQNALADRAQITKMNELKIIGQQLQNNEQFTGIAKNLLLSLNPDSPTFQDDVMDTADKYGALLNHFGVPQEHIEPIVQNAFTMIAKPDNVRRLQTQIGGSERRPTEFEQYKSDPEGFKAMHEAKRAPEKEEDKDYAPDMQTWVNNKTGEDMAVNARNAREVALAEKAGFSPESARERGYGVRAGQADAAREEQINNDSAKARVQMASLDAMDDLLDRFESGKLAKIGMIGQQYLNSLGIDVDTQNLGAKEAFLAITEQLALQSRNMGEGMVLAGQMSDRDVQFLRNMNPQLIISKDGNRIIINMRKAIAKRANSIARHMRDFIASNDGRFNATKFDAYLEENLSNTSIFGIPENAEIIGTDSVTGLPMYETEDGKTIIPNF